MAYLCLYFVLSTLSAVWIFRHWHTCECSDCSETCDYLRTTIYTFGDLRLMVFAIVISALALPILGYGLIATCVEEFLTKDAE